MKRSREGARLQRRIRPTMLGPIKEDPSVVLCEGYIRYVSVEAFRHQMGERQFRRVVTQYQELLLGEQQEDRHFIDSIDQVIERLVQNGGDPYMIATLVTEAAVELILSQLERPI